MERLRAARLDGNTESSPCCDLPTSRTAKRPLVGKRYVANRKKTLGRETMGNDGRETKVRVADEILHNSYAVFGSKETSPGGIFKSLQLHGNIDGGRARPLSQCAGIENIALLCHNADERHSPTIAMQTGTPLLRQAESLDLFVVPTAQSSCPLGRLGNTLLRLLRDRTLGSDRSLPSVFSW